MKKRILAFACVLLGFTVLAAPKVLPFFEKTPSAIPVGTAVGAISTVKVKAVRLQPTLLPETVFATGTLRAEEGVELQTDVAGKIVHIGFEEGSMVRGGDLLVKIYDADLQASLERAVARRNLAATRAKRIESLFQHGGTNQQDFDAALSEVQVQEAEIRLIEAQISKTEIRAPFDGVVGLRAVSMGAYVAPATRIATLQRLDRIKLDFAVPERFAARIQSGSPVEFTVSGAPEVFIGTVYAAEPRVDVSTRTLQVRAAIDNRRGRLRPGAFAQVEFKVGETTNALLVPAEAVIPGLSEKNVFVAVDGRAARRTVRTGARTEAAVQIVDGLAPGDLVITSGLQTLRAGAAVAVTVAE